MEYGDFIKVKVDRQGCIVIPKDARKRYGLIEGTELEMITHEGKIELISLVMKDDPAIIILREPCKTGDFSKHDLAFSRERAWRR
jgi:AbrB family looped-hinge helix DNA binding protein